MKTYFKCVWVNKATLLGYISSLLSTALLLSDVFLDTPTMFIGVVLGEIGIATLALTLFGLHTLHAYHRATLILIHDRIFSSTLQTSYCTRVGIKLAQKEHGSPT